MVRFHICKTISDYDEDHNELPPCEGAFRAPCVHTDRRTFKTAAAYDASHFVNSKGEPDLWGSNGRNHRMWEGGICRDFDSEDWFVEVDDLLALLAFALKHGECIIGRWIFNSDIISIEIYNGYRE